MKISLIYKSGDKRKRVGESVPKYRSQVEVSQGANIETLLENLGAKGLHRVINGVPSDEVLTNGRFEEGEVYQLTDYRFYKMKEEIARRFNEVTTEPLSQ